jgi:signal recognition particle receptor subunit beta
LALLGQQSSAPVKVVVTGAPGSGKTTFVRTIADMTVATQEPHPRGKGMISIDFGRITISKELVIYLYGMRTQEELKDFWQAWKEGMLGFILVVRAGQPEAYGEAAEYFRHFVEDADWPFLVVINSPAGESDELGDPEDLRAEVASALAIADTDFVVVADARNRSQVKESLLTFLSLSISPKLERAIARNDTSASSA